MNVHHRRATTALLVATSFGVSSAANAVSTFYTITDLGTLGGGYSYATGINNSGQVVGEWSNAPTPTLTYYPSSIATAPYFSSTTGFPPAQDGC